MRCIALASAEQGGAHEDWCQNLAPALPRLKFLRQHKEIS
jgi:hypothetical protein